MRNELIESTVRQLYEGRGTEPRLELDPHVEFHDPVVIVRGRPGVVGMFARLNRMFPSTTVEGFEPADESGRRFLLRVHYRRDPQSTPRLFESSIEMEITRDRISRITEHWRNPIALDGDSPNSVLGMMRSVLGRLVS